MTSSKPLRTSWDPGAKGHRIFGPIAPPAGERVILHDRESFVVTAKLDEATGARLGREAIQEGLLRPADSHLADIESAQLVWVPLWRLERHDERVSVVLARRVFPFDPSDRVVLALGELSPRSEQGALSGEEIVADVARDEAIGGRGARVRSAVVCWYPVWLRRYVYEGKARMNPRQPEECHVAISARTGEVVSARHPSVFGALKTRVTRLFMRG